MLYPLMAGCAVGVLVSSLVWMQRERRLRSEIEHELPAGDNNLTLGLRLQQVLADSEASRYKSEQRLQECKTILRAAPIGYLLLDRDNQLVEYNASAAAFLDIRDCWSAQGMLLGHMHSEELDELVLKARQTHATHKHQWTLSTETREIAVTGTAVCLHSEQVCVFIEDRSEVDRLLQQRDRWVGDVAHELKTPLTSIRLVAELVLPRIDQAQRSWVERLLREVHRLEMLIQDLLDLSQWEAGSEELFYEPGVDLVRLIKETWSSLEPLAARRDTLMEWQGPSTAVVWGDESRLYRALLNLLDNAIKYNPPHEPFYIRLGVEDEWVHLEIIDHGPGFPPKDLERVFERFYRADPARARQTGGTGLGLAIVRQIIEAHHGTILARNHPETGGAWLSIDLPVNIPPEQKG
ncbi:MAG: PAS domain-containing sensor histidine kinase [Gemmatimonadaceae bacterium]|nr:PAS domain-containing sensor histidine kinase [Gloeobacterales cyanobacterium ES-bin-141]